MTGLEQKQIDVLLHLSLKGGNYLNKMLHHLFNLNPPITGTASEWTEDGLSNTEFRICCMKEIKPEVPQSLASISQQNQN